MSQSQYNEIALVKPYLVSRKWSLRRRSGLFRFLRNSIKKRWWVWYKQWSVHRKQLNLHITNKEFDNMIVTINNCRRPPIFRSLLRSTITYQVTQWIQMDCTEVQFNIGIYRMNFWALDYCCKAFVELMEWIWFAYLFILICQSTRCPLAWCNDKLLATMDSVVIMDSFGCLFQLWI